MIEPLDTPEWNLTLLPHNWKEWCELETAFQTTVTAADDSVKEERRSLVGAPSRTVTFQWRGLDRATLQRMLVALRNLSSGYWPAPLYPDQAPLAQDYSSGTTIYLDTTYRRFFEGGRILVLDEAATSEFAEIEEVQDDRLILTEELSNIHQAGLTLVLPCIDVEPVLAPVILMSTNRVGTMALTTQEVRGKNLLPGWSGAIPGLTTFMDLPILDLEHNWVDALELEYLREGDLFTVGRGRSFFLRGDRPRVAQKLNLTLEREDAMRLIRLFEERKGRAKPFWFMDPEDIWEVVAKDANGINITPIGEYDDFREDLDYLGIRDVDGTPVIRKVSSTTNFTTYWRITVETALPAGMSAALIVSAARARVVRFDSDALNEEWLTDNSMRTEIKLIELLEEGF